MKQWLRSLPGRNYGEYLLARGAAGIVNTLPIEMATWIARRIGDLLYALLKQRRNLALQNLDLAFQNELTREQKKRIAREAFRNLVTFLMEFFRIPSMLRDAHRRFKFAGTEFLDRALAKGKGVVFVVSHVGSWEYLEFLQYLRGYPILVIVRYVKNPYIYQWLQELRRKTKVHPIDRERSVREILAELRQNHMVAILIDQWAGNEGLWVEFFGEETLTTSIPVRLAHRTGAALVPGYCLRIAPGQYKIVIEPEVSIEGGPEDFEVKTTRKLNALLEQNIRQYPTQWLWTHRRWKTRKTEFLKRGGALPGRST